MTDRDQLADSEITPASDDELQTLVAQASSIVMQDLGYGLAVSGVLALIARIQAERARADTAQKAGMERAALICEHYTACFDSARARSVTQTCADAIRAEMAKEKWQS